MSAPWLVAVDMQAVFGDPSSPWCAPEYARASAGIQRLLPAFGDRSVFTRFVAPVEPRGAWGRYYEQWPFALVPESDPLYALTPPFADLAPHVETRSTFGKWDPQLAAAVGGASEIVVAGVATDCCVIATALAAADAGVHVRLAVDACAGGTASDHQRALEAMELFAPLIELTTVDEVLASL
ncbi:MAG: cysteine hydrolase [Acidobacteria bacterium]|nr:cysteine hydrolase [Acidobacteriota bacterium]